MSYQKIVEESRRLAILRLLDEDSDYTLNDSVLQDALDLYGHTESRDVIRGDLAWLKQMGLVTIEVIQDRVHVSRLTARGHDVAVGRSVVPGIKRPRP